MKKQTYHVNKVLNKWEEEQHLKMMAKKIASAKSSLPPCARAGSLTNKGGSTTRQATTRPRVSGSTGGGDSGTIGSGIDVDKLDEMILFRLHEVLGQPQLQRVQNQDEDASASAPNSGSLSSRRPASDAGAARGGPATHHRPSSVPARGLNSKAGAAARAKAAAVAAAVKQRRRRPAWDEEWSALNPGGGSSGGPGGTSGPPQPKAPVPRAPSARAPAPKAPSSQGTAAARPPQPPPAAPQAQRRSTGDGAVGSRGAPLSPPLPSSSAHCPAPRVPSSRRDDNPILTRSDMSAIVTLNPSGPAAAAARSGAPKAGSPPTNVPKARSSSVGAARPVPAGGTIAAAAAKPRAPAAAAAPPLVQRVSASKPKPEQPAEEEDEDEKDYSADEFDSFDAPEGDDAATGDGGTADGDSWVDGVGGVGGAGGPVNLRASLAELNLLVQLKIQDVRASKHLLRISVGAGAGADAGGAGGDGDDGDDDDSDSLFGDGEPSPGPDGLGASDLEYLARLPSSQNQSARGSRPGASADFGAEEDDGDDGGDMCLEAGPAMAEGHQWGDRAPFAAKDHNSSLASASSRIQDIKQRVASAGGAAAAAAAAAAEAAPAASGRLSRPPSARTSLASLAAENVRVASPTSVVRRSMPGAALMPVDKAAAAALRGSSGLALAAGASPDKGPTSCLRSSGSGGAVAAAAAGEEAGLAQETQNLFSSLKQLHRLMSGPAAAQLTSPSRSRSSSGTGFTPPPGMASRPLSAASSNGGFGGSGSPARLQLPSEHARNSRPNGFAKGGSSGGEVDGDGDRGAEDGGGAAPGGGRAVAATPAPELTPKHQLTPDDVLWMGGVMKQFRQSLDISCVSLPGL